MTSLVELIGRWFGHERPPDRGDTALQLADEVATRARSLREQLEPFRVEIDPFAAIVMRRILAENHEDIAEIKDTPRAPT